MGGVSLTQLLIVLVIVALIFGTKKLRNIGSDLGGAVKGFKKGIADDDEDTKELSEEGQAKTAEEEKQTSEK